MKQTTFYADMLFIAPALFLGILLFPVESMSTSPVSSRSLIEALSLYHFNGALNLDRGPGFPMFLAFSFHVFGISIKSGAIVIRSFFILNIIATFIVARSIFDKRVALLASLLVASSFGIYYWSLRLLVDNIVPFFMLMFIFTVFNAYNHKKQLYFILSGIIIGLSFLIKENAVLFFIYPFFFLLFKQYRSSHFFKGNLIFAATVLITLTPWIYYVIRESGTVMPLLGHGVNDVSNAFLVTDELQGGSSFTLFSKMKELVEALITFYNLQCDKFPLRFFFLIAWVCIIAVGIRKRRLSDIAVISLIVPLAVGVFFLGRSLGREANWLIVFFVSYIVLSKVIVTSGSYLFGKVKKGLAHKKSKIVAISAFLVSIIGLIVVILSNSQSQKLMHKAIEKISTNWTCFVLNEPAFSAGGRHSRDVEEACKLVKELRPTASEIMTDGYIEDSSAFFLWPKNIHHFTPDLIRGHLDLLNPDSSKATKRPLAVISYGKMQTKDTKNYRVFYFVFPDDLVEFVDGANGNLIMIFYRSAFFWKYFQTVEWAKIIFENSQVRIFEIHKDNMKEELKKGRYDTYIGEHVKGDLEWLKDIHFDEYTKVDAILTKFGLKK